MSDRLLTPNEIEGYKFGDKVWEVIEGCLRLQDTKSTQAVAEKMRGELYKLIGNTAFGGAGAAALLAEQLQPVFDAIKGVTDGS